MDKLQIILAVSALLIIAFQAGTRYILRSANNSSASTNKFNNKKLYSLPKYYGYCVALWSVIPACMVFLGISMVGPAKLGLNYFENNSSILPLVVSSFALICAALYFMKPSFNAREHFEKQIKRVFTLCSYIAVSITILIFISILFESLKFFDKVNFFDFIFGLEWSPQTAMRTDQAGSSGSFGMIPVFLGTFIITVIAMIVAVPVGLLSAIYLSEYAKPKLRGAVKPILEILAGVPTVVYGYFAAITVGPLLRDIFAQFNIEVASESALAAGLVMGIMIIPFIMSLTDDVMSAVPQSLREASLGLGATKSETVKKVIIPAALPGIMGAFILAVSRAIGETMIVVMAAGLIATLSVNPLESVTTVTVQIVRLLTGDQEFDSAKTLSAFALSLALFVITLALNFAALAVVRKYRERYE